MAKIFSIVNFKGGVGKTTITVNLAASIAKLKNKKVLIVDMDPQMNATAYCLNMRENWEKIQTERKNIYFAIHDWIKQDSSQFNLECYILKSVIQKDQIEILPNLDILAGSIDMIDSNRLFLEYKNKGKEISFLLGDILKTSNYYDFIFIDTPPSLYIETRNALLASHGFIVAFTPEPFVHMGLEALLKKVHQISLRYDSYKNPHTKFLGVVFTKVSSNYAIHKDFINTCIERMQDQRLFQYGINPNENHIFQTQFKNRVAYLRSTRDNLPIICNSKKSEIEKEIQDFMEEFLNRI
jgi:chromosome partitioning protein